MFRCAERAKTTQTQAKHHQISPSYVCSCTSWINWRGTVFWTFAMWQQKSLTALEKRSASWSICGSVLYVVCCSIRGGGGNAAAGDCRARPPQEQRNQPARPPNHAPRTEREKCGSSTHGLNTLIGQSTAGTQTAARFWTWPTQHRNPPKCGASASKTSGFSSISSSRCSRNWVRRSAAAVVGAAAADDDAPALGALAAIVCALEEEEEEVVGWLDRRRLGRPGQQQREREAGRC